MSRWLGTMACALAVVLWTGTGSARMDLPEELTQGVRVDWSNGDGLLLVEVSCMKAAPRGEACDRMTAALMGWHAYQPYDGKPTLRDRLRATCFAHAATRPGRCVAGQQTFTLGLSWLPKPLPVPGRRDPAAGARRGPFSRN